MKPSSPWTLLREAARAAARGVLSPFCLALLKSGSLHETERTKDFISLLLIILTYCYLGVKFFFSWKCLGLILKERFPPSDNHPPLLKLIIPFTAAALLVWI